METGGHVEQALRAANLRRAQLQKATNIDKVVDLATLKDLQDVRRRGSHHGLNSRFTRNTMVGAVQANRYREANQMWRAREQQRGLDEANLQDDTHQASMYAPKAADARELQMPAGTRQDHAPQACEEPLVSRRRASSSSSSGSDVEQQNGAEWSLDSFLASKAKRGRGAVGSRAAEPHAESAAMHGLVSDSDSERNEKSRSKRKRSSSKKECHKRKHKKHKDRHRHKNKRKKDCD
mmetsp:Transcript_24213/g.45959  ORF Transcript_24213/g.45959 Transcript_24213/m.45959 type:complete len:236 (-) Transcript_24213:361-1068(-)|eukprot:CAMPEP_0114249886 /NCGR_PEP_ID=MMETSP0058-20121206/14399_1 /TAXON_ID=36894 /ORGANISM="Pyramimonas parkeae, CCMP726" /LENGTH=235 /DNA_ID=CAMNT_0001363497 /DNA_START=243 /DNA_END=950 /DNA_ORIENTATION=+